MADEQRKDWEDRVFTKAEAEAHYRLTKRWCRGPCLLSDDVRTQFNEQNWHVSTHEAAIALHKELLSAHKFPLQTELSEHHGIHEPKNHPQLRLRIFALTNACADTFHRSVCGYDMNEVHLTESLDGLDHKKVCPRCGTLQYWHPAKYNIVG
jgi:hypothetical protein